MKIDAPFPYFGGKRTVASHVWARLGDVPNYCEPFAGSLAVLLGRPTPAKTETVNDKCGFIANFWRAVKSNPEEVAVWADNPVNENDLHARHVWLVNQAQDLAPRLEGDPEYYDAKIAGWWVWGICSWISGGWCSGRGPWWPDANGVLARDKSGRIGPGVCRQRPMLGWGVGVNRKHKPLTDWFAALQNRLRKTRVICGDWSRTVTKTPTTIHGVTGVFLDPPYDPGLRDEVYRVDGDCAREVNKWCVANGPNPLLRIALCGYDGEHNILEEHGWSVWAWKAHGGHANRAYTRGRDNAKLERIWFSPACLPITETQPQKSSL